MAARRQSDRRARSRERLKLCVKPPPQPPCIAVEEVYSCVLTVCVCVDDNQAATMTGMANGDPKAEPQAEGSLAGFETIEALLEVCLLQTAGRVSDVVLL